MRGNPLNEFISDEIYKQLASHGFFNDRAIRDYYLKKRYEILKDEHTPKKIFLLLREEVPYLSLDTVRKIVYSRDEI